jgi:hypothetical protein
MMTMVISGSDGVTFPDSTNQFSGGAFSFKNRIINGDMRIDQRNAGASVTIVSGGANYAIDRFATLVNTSEATTCSIQRVSDAPANFSNSYKFTTGTGAAGTGSQQARFYQPVEGLNVDDFAWGTANAKTVTLSFYVKASQSGTFGGCLRNDGGTRSYPFTYSISATNTWEYKTVTIPGDTTGTWLKDNGIGILVLFDLGSGPDFLGTPNSWAAANYLGATGGTSTVAVSSATWQITGVQLEVGSVATPFERRPYGTELMLCQRYYQFVGGETPYNYLGTTASITSTTTAYLPVPLQVTMRAAPTFTYAGALSNFDLRADGNATHTPTALANDQLTSKICGVTITTTGITANTPGILIGANSTASKLIFSAEL